MISKGKKSVALCAAVLTALSISCTIVSAEGITDPYFSVNSKDQINNDGKGAKGANSVAIGPGSTTKFRNGLSVGTNNVNEGYETTVVGSLNKAYGLVPGYEWASGATIVGTGNTIMSLSGVMALGSENIVHQGVAIGAGNKAMGENAVALGNQSSAMNTDSIGIGFSAHSYADAVIAIGRQAEGTALGGVAIGRYAKVNASTGVALGESSVSERGAGVVGYMPGAVGQTAEEVAAYLGKAEEYKSWKADVEANKDAYTRSKAWHAATDAERQAYNELNEARVAYAKSSTEANKKAVTEKYYAWKKADAERTNTDMAMRKTNDYKTINDLNARYGQIFGKLLSTEGAVSVGDEKTGRTRQIINVAAGTKDTDAVNVYQLKDAVKSMKDSVTGGLESKVDADAGNLTDENVAAWQTKLGNGKNEAGNTGLVTGDTLNKALDGLDLDGNLANKADKNAGNLEDADKEAWRVALGGGTVAKGDKKFVDGDTVAAALENMGGQVTGKANTSLDNITDAGKTVIKDLAKGAVKVADGEHTTVRTEEKGGVVTYKVDVKADGKVAKDDKGIVTGGTVYAETRPEQDGKYVKKDNRAGQNFTALDMQVGKNAEDITKLGSTVYDMGMRVGQLDTRVNKVGAGSAALAALHPLDFDPEDKWNFAAGYGHYKGTDALAIGAFYRPNENKMVSIGGSFGGGENMINAGISFKIGQGTSPYAGVSKAQLAQRISRQDEIIRRQDEELAAQKAQIREILAQLEAMKKA